MSEEVLIAVLTPLMPFLVSGAVVLFHRLMSKLPANKQAQALTVAQIVIPAVEQMYTNLPGSGVQKKAEAIKLATAMLNDLGLKVSPTTLNALIESAVHSLPPKVQG